MISFKDMRIAIMSVADIMNYGDLLFPFIARKKLLRYFPNATFRFFTPTECYIENEHFYQYSRENISEFDPYVILTVGGEVIHKYDKLVWNEMYKGNPPKPSKVFFDWINLPVYKAWFSVGALDICKEMDEPITIEEISKLQCVGTRGVLSKKILENKDMFYFYNHIDIVPDVGWLFADYFKNYKLTLCKLSQKYKFLFLENNYIVLNINHTSISEETMCNVLKKIENFIKEKNLKLVILNAISTYKNIYDGIKSFVENNNNIIYLDKCNLSEIGAVLCGCKFFIGSSLHCAMTALSNQKQAAVIHEEPLTKLQDMFGHMMRLDLLTDNWDEIEYLLQKLDNPSHIEKKIQKKYVAWMKEMFNYKFEKMVKDMDKSVNIPKKNMLRKILTILSILK